MQVLFPAFFAALGCLLGRLLGKPLGICPFMLSALIAAVLPLAVASLGLLGASPQVYLNSLLVGAGGAVGTYLSGHNSRMRAVSCAFGGGLGATLFGVAFW